MVKSLIGQNFSKLTVLDQNIEEYSGKRRFMCVCQCKCGNIKKVLSDSLKGGKTTSCGCTQKENHYIKHNMSDTRFYYIWNGIRMRCNNINDTCYSKYGGRGISICDKWLTFENFKDDMYDSYLKHIERYGEKQTTIDRINSLGNYEPSNCRWATYKEQNNNKRKRQCKVVTE